MGERAPAGLGTTAQAVFTTVSYGLAAIVGALGGGYLYDRIGMAGLFRVLFAVGVASLAVLWAALRIPRRQSDKPSGA
jgi:predicted MFS family arabinose efflux permease